MKGEIVGNKILSLFLVAFLFVGIITFVSASDVGSTIPTAKRIGFFNNWIDHIRLAFTFNKEKKIDLILHMAEKQLSAGEALGGNNSVAYNKTQANYDKLMVRANKIFSEIQDVNNKSSNDSIKELNNIVRIQNMFERHRDHADEIYTRAIKRFESKNISQKRIERFESFYNKSLDRSKDIEDRIIQKRRNALQRYQGLTNSTNESVRELMDRIDDNEGLTMARKIRMKNFERRTEYFKSRRVLHAERIRSRFEDFNDDLSEARQRNINKTLQKIAANRAINRERFEMIKNRTHERIPEARDRIEHFKNRSESEQPYIKVRTPNKTE